MTSYSFRNKKKKKKVEPLTSAITILCLCVALTVSAIVGSDLDALGGAGLARKLSDQAVVKSELAESTETSSSVRMASLRSPSAQSSNMPDIKVHVPSYFKHVKEGSEYLRNGLSNTPLAHVRGRLEPSDVGEAPSGFDVKLESVGELTGVEYLEVRLQHPNLGMFTVEVNNQGTAAYFWVDDLNKRVLQEFPSASLSFRIADDSNGLRLGEFESELAEGFSFPFLLHSAVMSVNYFLKEGAQIHLLPLARATTP